MDDRLAALRGFMSIVWSGRFTVLITVLAVSGFALAAAFIPAPIYKATVTMAPAQQLDVPGGLSALMGQVGGVASLVGLGGGMAPDEKNAIAILRSRAFAESFLREANLLPVLFARKWDATRRSWKSDEPDFAPTMDDAWELFDKKIRIIVQDQKTGIVTLSIRWKDRTLAAEWANQIAQRINAEMRRRINSEADASLAILEDQLPKTTIVELRDVIVRLTEAQIRRKILANSRPDFAFAIVDPATVPDAARFDSPKRLLIILLGVAGGLIIGVVLATYRAAMRRSVTPPREDLSADL